MKKVMRRTKVKPVCLIAGGPGTSRRNLVVLFKKVFKVFDLDSPKIAYIGAASGDSPSFFKWLKDILFSAGARGVVLAPVACAKCDLEGAKGILRDADVVFISGGDVEEGMQLLREKKLIPVLRRLFTRGVPFFGLSAGSIMLSRCWVRWSDPNDDTTVKLFPCLGFAPVVCDTHGEDEDWEELRALLKLAKRTVVGYGITSSAGLIVMPGGRVKTIGGPVHLLKVD